MDLAIEGISYAEDTRWKALICLEVNQHLDYHWRKPVVPEERLNPAVPEERLWWTAWTGAS